MGAEGRRLALVIASSRFNDPTLTQLVAPGRDAADLARVLTDPAVGDFEVKTLIDRPSHEVRREIELFFSGRQRDDFLVLYFSSHGIKDDDGRLYLVTTDTDRALLRTSTVPAGFVNELMTACRSRRQLLILDCCHSGAFARGMVAKGGADVGIRDQFEGRGRVVLTASNSTQYAFQGDEVVGSASRSVFTRHLVQGLETGEADHDGDGWISLDELYDYVYARVNDETPQQSPGLYAFDVQGDLLIARSRLGQRQRQSDDPELAKQYSRAMAALTAGQWRAALDGFATIQSQRPDYRDVADRVGRLRELAGALGKMGPAPRGWRHVVGLFPVVVLLLAALLPNSLTSPFNFFYNREAIVQPKDSEAVERVFMGVALAVNGVGFPLGLAVMAYLAWPVARRLRQLQTGDVVTADDLPRQRARCLKLGHYFAAVGVSLWALAGPIYPIMLEVIVGSGTMTGSDYVYFIASLALCGLIAAVYPFFGATFLSVRVLYPPLVRPGTATPGDGDGLEWLNGLTLRYLLLAGAVPLLAITLVLLGGAMTGSTKQSALLGVLGLGALAGFFLAFLLFRAIQGDLAILKQAVVKSRPGVNVRTSGFPTPLSSIHLRW